MTSLWETVAARGANGRGALHAPGISLELSRLSDASCLGGRVESFRGRSILLVMREQLSTAIALLELDGIARRLVLCTPDLSPETLSEIATVAGTGLQLPDLDPSPVPGTVDRQPTFVTEWILLTSGTTGTPKLVAHTLSSLAGALPRQPPASGMVWSTFYDIRRYGGLQIFLRAALGGTSLVLSSAHESTADFLARAASHGVTHISGTPSHWRRALMSPSAQLISPRYVRLSGEIADQAILNRLRSAYPEARIAHAFASTEAGVAFDVNDGSAGFSAEVIAKTPGVEMKVEDRTLRIRSPRAASRYLGGQAPILKGADGFIDTGDILELRDGRYYFAGRRDGVINVGGLKVYPEEIEAVINRHPEVQMSLVHTKKNPFTGALVVADVVLRAAGPSNGRDMSTIQDDILLLCRETLSSHKIPAAIHFVPGLPVGESGKVMRRNA